MSCVLIGRCRRSLRASWGGAVRALLVVAATSCVIAKPQAANADEIQVAHNPLDPISVAADSATHWREGVYDVWHLRGNCYLNQGLTYSRGPEAVLWIDSRQEDGAPTKVIAYFEAGEGGDVAIDYRRAPQGQGGERFLGQQRAPSWFGRLESSAPLRWNVPAPAAAPAARPPIYERGLAEFNPDRRRQLMLAQYNEMVPTAPVGVEVLPPGMVRVQTFPRSDAGLDLDSQQVSATERVTVASGGIRILVEGLPTEGLPAGFGPLGVLDLSTDRAVIWHGNSVGMGGGTQGVNETLEIYMEGNIEFRQGDRIVYADRMYYDVRRQIGVILNAELLTPLPPLDGKNYGGLVRLKAAAIRQLDQSHFQAHDAQITTSRLEEPAYAIGSREITFTDVQQGGVDPLTGLPMAVQHQQLAEARGNFIYARGVPVFYWPTFATDLQEPSFIIDRVKIGNDGIFGTQFMVDWDVYQMLGIRNKPQGTDWGLSTDYLSERGFGFGTDYEYHRQELFGFIGPADGAFDFWAIKDDGLDNLGRNREAVIPEETFRYRLFGEHRQRLDSGWDITGEAGLISDRTFLEQYFEQQWDNRRSPRTGVRAKRLNNNRSLSIEANGQVNDFFTETQWLPRLDHYWLGESLLGDRLTWYAHSQAAYADQNVASFPTNATTQNGFTYLPWEVFPPGIPPGNPVDSSGERLITRQEIDLPVQVGAVKVVPYLLGELGRWGEALDGDSLERAYGQAGVRASLPMWAVYPNVRDPLFNLNGLAHKVVFDAEFSYADADENFDEFPLYDQLDDTSITEMRRRLMSGAFPPTITDPKFDPRTYALRYGMQNWVTSPAAEIADDLMALRMGVRQRWQTKRGPAGDQHIVDWLTLDMNGTIFPDADRDNFGEEVGLLDYDMRWHIGDRFTFLSDGAADVFSDGFKTFAAGVLINRPTRGNGYLGVRTIGGPISSTVLLGSYNYRISQKWIASASAAIDFDETGNIGQAMSITRIGESMFATVGFNVDEAKDNIGITLAIEPRFLPNSRVSRRTGIDVLPVGVNGLE